MRDDSGRAHGQNERNFHLWSQNAVTRPHLPARKAGKHTPAVYPGQRSDFEESGPFTGFPCLLVLLGRQMLSKHKLHRDGEAWAPIGNRNHGGQRQRLQCQVEAVSHPLVYRWLSTSSGIRTCFPHTVCHLYILRLKSQLHCVVNSEICWNFYCSDIYS